MKWLNLKDTSSNQKSETALSEKSYNDATVKALFRLMEKLKENDHVINMEADNRMTSTGLYKVELTATYDKGSASNFNNLQHLKSKLDKAMQIAKGKGKGYTAYPANQVAKIYRENDIQKTG